MNRVLVSILLVSLLAPLAQAQQPDPEVPDWYIGWEVEDEKAIMELDGQMNFELTLTFWVSNSRPVPQDLAIDVEVDGSFTTDYPSQISAEGNSNKTFDLVITGSGYDSDGDLRSAMAMFDKVVLTATHMMAQQNVGEREIDKELWFSQVFGFDIEMNPASGAGGLTIKSGTNEMVNGKVILTGNTEDAMTKVDLLIKKCPQMNHEIISGLTSGEAIGGYQSFEIKLIAPSNHPDKECTLSVTVTSEGNGLSYSGEFDFTVEAPEDKKDDPKEEPKEKDDPSDFDVESGSLPAPSLLSGLLIVLIAAVIRRD